MAVAKQKELVLEANAVQGGYQPRGGGHKPPAPTTGSGVVPANDATSLMHVISRAASDPSVDIDKLERLISMHNGIVSRQNEHAFNDAMTLAQKSMRRIAADSNNPQTRSKYASYAALDRAIRPVYTEHGFSLTFNTGDAPEGFVRVVCDVSNGGFTRHYHIDMPIVTVGPKGNDVMTKVHATGSAITYGRRYLLAMIFNLAVGDDDDGNAAGDAAEKISDDDAQNLKDMLAARGAPEVKFLQWVSRLQKQNIDKLQDIAAKHYDACVEVIKNYQKDAGK